MSDVNNCHREIVQAIEKIDYIFFTDLATTTAISNAKANQSEVISLCQRFPALVSRTTFNAIQLNLHASYKAWYKACGRNITPLGYLVVSGASAATIKKFVSSHKKILSESSFLHKHSPLHFAAVHCKLAKPGVIRLLTRAFPAEVSRKMEVNQRMTKPRLPLFELLKHGDDSRCLQGLKALAKATYPAGLGHEDAVELLSLVFQNNNPIIVGYMIDFILVAQPGRVIAPDDYYKYQLCKCHAQGISKLLSTGRVTDLRLRFESMAQDVSLIDLFDSLRGCASVEVLHLYLDFNEVHSDWWDVFTALERCLLAKSDSLRQLQLSGPGWYAPDFDLDFDLTEPVLSFLASNTMTGIAIDTCFFVKTAPIYDALKDNKCLGQLKIIQDFGSTKWDEALKALASVIWHYNTTLWRVYLKCHDSDSSEWEPEEDEDDDFYFVIKGLAALNARGRGDLRDPNVSVGKVVDLLVYLNSEDVTEPGYDKWPHTKLNYAILRECPGTWSSPVSFVCKGMVSGRKRMHSRISQH